MSFTSREEALASIRDRAAADPEFRALLLSDPAAAVTRVIGRDVPESVTIAVHEESPTDIHLVIPTDEDLSETDLELVAGGAFSWTVNNSGPGCGCI